MGSDVDGEVLGAELKGYTLRITGGNDKQGFTMKQGVLVNGRVRILLRSRTTLYRPRRTGERKRKSVRGCICGPDLAVIALRVLEKGPGEVPGLTDAERPRRLGKKRAANIRVAFALRKKDNVCKYVVRRPITGRGENKDKTRYKSPSVQRLITDRRLRRKNLMKKAKKDKAKATKEAHTKYEKLLSKFLKEKKAAAKKTTDEKTPVTPAKTPEKKEAAPKKEVKKEAPKPTAKPTKGKK